MANWQNKLDLIDLWQDKDKLRANIKETGKEIAKRIRNLRCFQKYEDELEEIALNFESVDEDIEELDSILSDLYDWADTPIETPKGQMQKKLCWIATF